MEFFRIKKDIPFMRHALVFNVISLITFLLAVFFLFTRGLHLSVEFTGGTLIEVNYAQAADLEKIRGSLGKAGYTDSRCRTSAPVAGCDDPPAAQSDQNTRPDRRIGDGKALDAEAPGASCAASSSSARRSARNSPKTERWRCCW
jgi:preprotein translocase subunit SecF